MVKLRRLARQGRIADQFKEYRPFQKARDYAQSLKLKSETEWRLFCRGEMPQLGRLPDDIPAAPQFTYAKKGWNGYGDWLGTGHVAHFLKQFRPFLKARGFVRKLRLKNTAEWYLFCKTEIPRLGRLPADIPTAPNQVYADKGWKGMGDWLGTGTVAPNLREYRQFGKARSFARKLKLKGVAEWYAFCKGKMPELGRLPIDIPVAAWSTYADKGWKGMGDWLGTGTLPKHTTKGEA